MAPEGGSDGVTECLFSHPKTTTLEAPGSECRILRGCFPRPTLYAQVSESRYRIISTEQDSSILWAAATAHQAASWMIHALGFPTRIVSYEVGLRVWEVGKTPLGFVLGAVALWVALRLGVADVSSLPVVP
jgi:hypothetical protein